MKVGVITTSRADFSVYHPLLEVMHLDPFFEMVVFVLGSHNSQKFGETWHQIKDHAYNFVRAPDCFIGTDDAWGVTQNMAETTRAMGQLLQQHPLDHLICLGDRYEMLAAVQAVVPFGVPISHIGGGETTQGAMDEKFRHAITKLSDGHFTACEAYRNRVIQLGSDPSRTINVGALGVQSLLQAKCYRLEEMRKRYDVDFNIPTLLATYHPVTTLSTSKNQQALAAFCAFISKCPYQVMVTLGNADTYGDKYRQQLSELTRRFPGRVTVHDSLGLKGYYSAVKHASIVIGNSSSGIIEVASFNKPCINIGDRQKGRACSANIIHCASDLTGIENALTQAETLIGRTFDNIYYQPNTAQIIVEKLKSWPNRVVTVFNDLS